MIYRYFSDGSNSQPKGEGPAGCAFVIFATTRDDLGRGDTGPFLASTHCFPLKTGTNNECELRGVMEAVNHWVNKVAPYPDNKAIFHSDSQWVVCCLNQELDLDPPYYVTDKYPLLFAAIVSMWDHNTMQLIWIPRTENELADSAARVARYEAKELYK